MKLTLTNDDCEILETWDIDREHVECLMISSIARASFLEDIIHEIKKEVKNSE